MSEVAEKLKVGQLQPGDLISVNQYGYYQPRLLFYVGYGEQEIEGIKWHYLVFYDFHEKELLHLSERGAWVLYEIFLLSRP